MPDTIPVIATHQTTRFCVNCRYSDQSGDAHLWECKAPQNLISAVDPVTGTHKETWRYSYCSAQRISKFHGDNCSDEGRWFEPRESVVPVVEFPEAAE